MTRRMGSVCARAGVLVDSAVAVLALTLAAAARVRRAVRAVCALAFRDRESSTRRKSLNFIVGLRKKLVFRPDPSDAGLQVLTELFPPSGRRTPAHQQNVR